MNRELLAVLPETPVAAVRELMKTFGVGAVPVLDERRRPVGMVTARGVLDLEGAAADRMTTPAICIERQADFDAAARRFAQANARHLVVVDGAGMAIGLVSVLDVLRAMYGIPAHHPAAFPHWDETTHASWTDDWPLDEEHLEQAPAAAGILVLVRALPGETDAVVWAEACASVRERICSLIGPSSSAEPALARLLERHDLRFRAAVVRSELDRDRITSGLRSDLEHRPPPGTT